MNPRILFVLSVLSFLSPISVLAAENSSADCMKFVRHQAELKQSEAAQAVNLPATQKVQGETKTSKSAG